MIDPTAKARWVLETNNIGEVPALSLATIAESESIAHRCKSYPDDWDGMLVFKGKKRAILVNTRIESKGRHHFTFAHELGHYFLDHQPNYSSDGQLSIRCTLSDTSYEQKGREAEANCFAAELLMPESLFRIDMAGAPIDFALIGALANKYMVSKHAASNRILDITREPCIIITSIRSVIETAKASKAAKNHLRQMEIIPQESIADNVISNGMRQVDFRECSPQNWLAKQLANEKLYSCTRGKNNHYMTILRW